MDEDFAETSLIAHRPRRLRLLYEPLCLLYTLSQVRGDRITPSEISHAGLGLTGPRCYRSFVDAIAYICAYRKEPGYVTAVALEETPEDIVVLLAANGGIDTEVVKFLEKVLDILKLVIKKHIIRLDTNESQLILKFLADHVLSFNAPKIFEYYQQVNKMVSLVMDRQINEPHSQGTRFFLSQRPSSVEHQD